MTPDSLFRISTADDDAGRSLSGEPNGDGQPEALRAAGDDRDSGSVSSKNSYHSCQLTFQALIRRGQTIKQPGIP